MHNDLAGPDPVGCRWQGRSVSVYSSLRRPNAVANQYVHFQCPRALGEKSRSNGG